MNKPITKQSDHLNSGQNDARESLSKFGTVTQFLSEAIEVAKHLDVVKAIGKASPWATMLGETVSEALPPIKALIKLLEKVTLPRDPNKLGKVAFTLAYQLCVDQAIKQLGNPKTQSVKQAGRTVLRNLEMSKDIDTTRIDLQGAASHPFVKQAGEALLSFADSVGYTPEEKTHLLVAIQQRFTTNLKMVLFHHGLRERFEPYTALLESQSQAYPALEDHAAYQLWLFGQAPVFGKEPFALADVYLDTECGVLKWADIRKSQDELRETTDASGCSILDPFNEQCGGRHDLLQAVLRLIADKDFEDAIVVQGEPGAGKSSFTLRLFAELRKLGLQPIRVRFRDLRLGGHIIDDIEQAICLTDRNYEPGGPAYPRPEKILLERRLFRESILYEGFWLCPYVLILDGWDEISIGTFSEGFRERLDAMLGDLRRTFFQNPAVCVRVVLTGRPTARLSDTRFLRDATQLLTIRPIRPEQLECFTKSLSGILTSRPSTEWPAPDLKKLAGVFEVYRSDFERIQSRESPGPERGSLDVLGLPLLAHLAMRFFSKWTGDMVPLLQNPTALYRNLVDLTCAGGGQPNGIGPGVGESYRMSGVELRRLLQQTAAAITAFGGESISYKELNLRLESNEPDELLSRIATLPQDHKLSNLMISYYFRVGQKDLGCEFSHKGFREYLLAEHLVGILKEFGGQCEGKEFHERPQKEFWRDFAEVDPRHWLCRRLGNILALQWLTPEVMGHLDHLIQWEIERSVGDTSRRAESNQNPWERIRDGLADLWDWWAEGVHLRPQPHWEGADLRHRHALSEEWIKWKEPKDREPRSRIVPHRSITTDAFFGDGIFCLCAKVHYHLAKATGWLSPLESLAPRAKASLVWQGAMKASEQGGGHWERAPRRHQTLVRRGDTHWFLFAPARSRHYHFAHHAARINAVMFRLQGPFPNGVDLRGCDLRGTCPCPQDIGMADPWVFGFSKAALHAANLEGTSLPCAVLTSADLTDANLKAANLEGADLRRANLRGADLSQANLLGADLREAICTEEDLEGTDLTGAKR